MIGFLLAGLSLAIWLYLLLARGGFWRVTTLPAAPEPAAWPDIVAVIPARDEAAGVGQTVQSLLDYPGRLHLVLVDDQSRDGTADVARRAAAARDGTDRLTVVQGRPLPGDWTGKLWAMQQGLERAAEVAPEAAYVLLTDADIAHDAEELRLLVAHATARDLHLASLMVHLHCRTWPERLLIPAFVFFFGMLYPFRWVNRPEHPMAAAAGGCMLVKRTTLTRIGGVGSFRDALIDDCALAARIKPLGPIWLGHAEATHSLRVYGSFGEIWAMIARTAYTQLGYSPLLLAGTIAGMALTYLTPLAGVVLLGPWTPLALLAWLAMGVAFQPMLLHYGRQPFWGLALPLIALFYLGATIGSAVNYWRGKGGQWKGRSQAPDSRSRTA
jgi:hopene-associated glycosyltransferase HpnB